MKLRQRIEKQFNRIELSNKFSNAVFFANDSEFNELPQCIICFTFYAYCDKILAKTTLDLRQFMSIVKFILELEDTVSKATLSLNEKNLKTLIFIIKQLTELETKGTPYNSSSLDECKRFIASVSSDFKEESIKTLLLNLQKELSYFICPLITLIVSFQKRFPSHILLGDFNQLLKNWNHPGSEEIKLAEKVLSSCDDLLKKISYENALIITIQACLIRKFFPDNKKELNLYKTTQKHVFGNLDDERYLVFPVSQDLDESTGLDSGNCYGHARKFAHDIIQDPELLEKKSTEFKNYAAVTKEVAEYQKAGTEEKDDNSKEIIVRLGRKRYSTNPIEIATNISQLAYENKNPLLIIFKIHAKETEKHSCVIKKHPIKSTLYWYDDNCGAYCFPNSSIFIKWFEEKYKILYFRIFKYNLYQASAIITKDKYNKLSIFSAFKRNINGKATTILTGSKYYSYGGLMSCWFTARSYLSTSEPSTIRSVPTQSSSL